MSFLSVSMRGLDKLTWLQTFRLEMCQKICESGLGTYMFYPDSGYPGKIGRVGCIGRLVIYLIFAVHPLAVHIKLVTKLKGNLVSATSQYM